MDLSYGAIQLLVYESLFMPNIFLTLHGKVPNVKIRVTLFYFHIHVNLYPCKLV